MKKLLLIAATLFTAIALSACGGGDQNEALVGDWAWDVTNTWYYTFNADGSGTQWPSIAFEWETRGDELHITMAGSTQRWDWEIRNDVLTITSRQATGLQYSYIRMD